MARHLFRFRCPCCDKYVELDTRSGKARPLKQEEAAKPAADIDKLVEKQKHEGERLTDVFQQAASDQATQKKKLDDAFSQAFEDAKKDKEKPPNPFDLD
jgi:hypothetical protein